MSPFVSHYYSESNTNLDGFPCERMSNYSKISAIITHLLAPFPSFEHPLDDLDCLLRYAANLLQST